MKKLSLFFFLFFIASLAYTQRNADIGIIGGTGFYMGDINQEKVFYKPGYNAGIIFRYNFEERFSLRGKVLYASQSGSDDDFNSVIVGRPENTFSVSLVNPAIQVEFNFFPYKTGSLNYTWTPYIFGGGGYSFVLSNDNTASSTPANNHLNIPFGIGAKVNLTKRLSGGVEWTFNKTFSDRVDGVVPRTGESGVFKNDWYNFAGLFITYKFFKFAADCPAYD